MSYKIQHFNQEQKEKFNLFVNNHPFGSVHQLFEWGLFQSKSPMRDHFWAIAVTDEQNSIVATALLIRIKLPFGRNWLYCPRGPVFDYSNSDQTQQYQIWKTLMDEITKIAKTQKSIFLRLDPALNQHFTTTEQFKLYFKNFQKAHAHYQPEHTLLLDLNRSEDELLTQMKPKGRYNIKLASKKKLLIKSFGLGNSDFELKQGVSDFYSILTETTTRDNFSGHNQAYYQHLLEILGDRYAKLYLAYHNDKPIAGIINTFANNTAIYYFGASSNHSRNLMAPYLLQWNAITEAKKLNFQFYDFLGIAPENSPSHPWSGVTDFKIKFGGKRLSYTSAQELIFNHPFFQLIKFTKFLKSLTRKS